MGRLRIIVFFLLCLFSSLVSAQVKIRLFSDQTPESVVFTVITGNYKLDGFNGYAAHLAEGDMIVISKFGDRLAAKKKNEPLIICDSAAFTGLTGDDGFSLRINGKTPIKKLYAGDLKCHPDMETIVLINTSDVEKYIAGVVKAEGGSGRNIEYFKSQAVIARTYMYRYMNKHLQDRYNLCDNTHCQAYNGLSSDSVLNLAAIETKGQVILWQDSTLIISAFHSNCGGETAASEDVWLASQPYLKKVIDPYCTLSRSAAWDKKISMAEWDDYIRRHGYTGSTADPALFGFVRKSRVPDYTAGNLKIPMRTMRSDLNLRSAFFSVIPDGDSILFKGRGYGHGVGLCQEGAMIMALKGFDYRQIIDFYYSGVLITDIKNAVILPVGIPPFGLAGSR